MAPISVIVITYNEEKNIERCLKSLNFANEIIVVDSFSTDSTIEKAQKYTNTIIQSEYDNDISQRIKGFSIAKNEWLMYVDADEEVSDELQGEIKKLLNADTTTDGYYVVRKVFSLGRWIMHGGWYPDLTFRIFRKDQYKPEYAEVHGGFAPAGRTGTLNGCLYHYSYPTITEYIRKMNDYTSLQVTNKLNSANIVNTPIRKIIFSPILHFFQRYLIKKGYKDGRVGFVLAVLSAISTLVLYVKLWEYLSKKRHGLILPPVTNMEIRKLKKRYYSA